MSVCHDPGFVQCGTYRSVNLPKSNLTIAVGINDRTLPLIAGLVEIDEVKATYVTAPLEEIFARAFDEQAYDVTELSFSNYLYLTASGQSPYVGLPVFPSRSFRHSTLVLYATCGPVLVRLGDQIAACRSVSATSDRP